MAGKRVAPFVVATIPTVRHGVIGGGSVHLVAELNNPRAWVKTFCGLDVIFSDAGIKFDNSDTIDCEMCLRREAKP